MPTAACHREPLPPPAPFAVIVEEVRGQLRVRVVGELDVWTAPSLARALKGLQGTAGIPAQRRRDVVLDLSRLSFLDTAGLSALADARLALRTAGSRVRLVEAQPHVGRLLAYATEAGWLAQDALDPGPAG